MKDFYSILGVTPDSDDAEIKSAYRRLARKFHPDINPAGAQKFKEICEAYETLSNPKKRIQYDTINGFFKSSTQTKHESKNTSKNQTQSEYKKTKQENPQKKQVKKEDFSKKINEIFEEFGKKKSKPIPKKGDDIYENISITIKEARQGCERIVNIMHSCECPHCRGRKFINGSVCPQCNGSGEKIEYKKINVKIPSNVKNGTKLRIAQEGKAGTNGGKNGDLYLKIKLKQNSNIEFIGNDICYKLPISPFEAVLGGKINVPVSEGNLTLKIPPQTHSNQKFRLAGQGLNSNGKTGDIIVTVYIEIPSSLSDDEIRLYEKLRKLSAKNIRENL